MAVSRFREGKGVGSGGKTGGIALDCALVGAEEDAVPLEEDDGGVEVLAVVLKFGGRGGRIGHTAVCCCGVKGVGVQFSWGTVAARVFISAMAVAPGFWASASAFAWA